MKKVSLILSFLFLLNQMSNAQSGWFIQPSFTTMNLYDCKQSAIYIPYLASDSGTIFRTTDNGHNWTKYNFNDPLINNNSMKYIFGTSNDNWYSVGEGCALAYRFQTIDSVMRISGVSPQPTLEAFTVLIGYTLFSAAGSGGNFYLKDGNNWRKDTAATRIAAGRNINYNWKTLFVGDDGLIMKADSIGPVHSNGEKVKWRILPSGTTKNLYSISGGGQSYVAVGEDGIVLKSTDMGESWTQVTSETTEDLYAVWIGYAYIACGAHGTILRSYDSNFNLWYKQPTPSTQDLYFIMTLGYTEYISGGKNGIFLRTTDGGGARKTFYPNVLMEGFYNSSNNLLTGDTVSVSVRSAVSPYNILGSSKNKLNNTGYASFQFGPSILDSVPYYLQVKHRNSIEIWSKTPVIFSNHSLSYQFYTSANRAYGDNQKQVDASPVRFAMFSGDVNQDGNINGLDAGLTDNDAFNYVSGYVNTDVNGNNVVDVIDLGIIDNNAINFVTKIVPP